MLDPVYNVKYYVVPIKSSLLPINLHSSVTTTLVYNDTKYSVPLVTTTLVYNDTKYSVPLMTS